VTYYAHHPCVDIGGIFCLYVQSLAAFGPKIRVSLSSRAISAPKWWVHTKGPPACLWCAWCLEGELQYPTKTMMAWSNTLLT